MRDEDIKMKYRKEMPPPGELKELDYQARLGVCELCRDLILETVSKNGGHLASNLGVVELTVALHSVFDFPKDKIIFDVGHQSYVHKLLSGRVDKFGTLRQTNGLSGFQSRAESEYDCFGGGHSGTSVSAAMGFATAAKLKNDDSYAIAVVGDGSFSNGMIHEAINNAASQDLRLIIILNDNKMSISRNRGAISRCFGKLRSSARYHRFKRNFKTNTKKMHLIGRPIAALGRAIKNLVKRLVCEPNFFEALGVDYMGPVKGHDLKHLEAILNEAKFNNKVTIVHVCTEKGKGYEPAEREAEKFHSVGSFDIATGMLYSQSPAGGNSQSFAEAFGERLVWHANTNSDIVAITAAMCEGTGLNEFQKAFPERFFDVEIAEEHAVTFSAGLAAAGMRPVFAVYSSFLQRGYDQVIHDVAIQNLPVVFAISHAGLVSGDGMTHQGIFDCGFLLTVPNITIYSVENFNDMSQMLALALSSKGPVAIRYPKGGVSEYRREDFVEAEGYKLCSIAGPVGAKRVCLITHGRLTKQVYEAACALSDTYTVRVISITRLKPLNTDDIIRLCGGANYVYFIEEQVKVGGVGEILFAEMAQRGFKLPIMEINAISDFPKHGSLEDLFNYYGFSAEKITEHVRKVVG